MNRRIIFVLLSMVTLVTACGPSPSDQLQANKDLVHRFTEALNDTDWLCSRSRKGHVRWDVFQHIKQRYPLQRPKLRLPYRELQRLAVL